MTKPETLRAIEKEIADLARFLPTLPRCVIDIHLTRLSVTARANGFVQLASELGALRVWSASMETGDLASELLALSNPGGRRYAEAVMVERVPDGPRFETLAELIQSLRVRS